MKKKILLAATALCIAVGLTACGNPLKKLPESDDSVNWIEAYDKSEKTYGNQAIDAIVKYFDKEGVMAKEYIEGLYVLDRDDKDNKEKSTLSVAVETESEYVRYTRCYEIEMKYDADDKEWEVKEHELEEEESEKTVIKEQTEEDIINLISENFYDYVDDVYVYGYDMDIDELTIDSIEYDGIEEFYSNYVTCTYDVTVSFEYGPYSYVVEMSVYNDLYTYGGQDDCYSSYAYFDEINVVSCEMDPEIENRFTVDRVVEDINEYGFDFDYFDSRISVDDIENYSIDDMTIGTSSAYVYVSFDIVSDFQIVNTIHLYLAYDFEDGEYYIYSMYENESRELTYSAKDIEETHLAEIYNDDYELVGYARIHMEDVEQDDYYAELYFDGYIEFSEDEEFEDPQVIEIYSGVYYSSWMYWYIYLDDYIDFSDGGYLYYTYMYWNIEDQETRTTDDYSYIFVIVE